MDSSEVDPSWWQIPSIVEGSIVRVVESGGDSELRSLRCVGEDWKINPRSMEIKHGITGLSTDDELVNGDQSTRGGQRIWRAMKECEGNLEDLLDQVWGGGGMVNIAIHGWPEGVARQVPRLVTASLVEKDADMIKLLEF